MEFINKTESFFSQLQYCLAIEAEPVLQAKKCRLAENNGNYGLLLTPDIFIKLINEFNIEHPFIPENKIIELKSLIIKENISTKDALKIIENFKKQYWFLDCIVMFGPVTDKIKETLKSIDINISEKEIGIVLDTYKNYLQAKRESIYIDLINEIQSLPQQAETKTEQKTIEIKPILKPEAAEIVYEIIKDYFSIEQQSALYAIIDTGNVASEKLLFRANGNRLTDTFKKLIEHDFIIGCTKQDLINWIILRFTFTHQKKVKTFIYDTVEKTISRNDYPCKSPLIIIVNGQIKKVEQPRTKKYNKY